MNYMHKLDFQGTLRPSSMLIVNIFSLYTLHKNNNKKVRRFIKKILDFQNLIKIEFCWRLIFEILTVHKTFLGSCEVPNKIILVQSVQQFDVYRIQTDRKTDRQGKFIFIL